MKTAPNPDQLADPEIGHIDDLVDVDRYPLNRLDSATFGDLVSHARHGLATDGAITLPGFLRPEVTEALASDLRAAANHISIRSHRGTVYARDELESELAADDPRRVRLKWQAGHVTRDMMAPFTVAHRLYVSPVFKQFIAQCVGRTRIFEYADPIAGLVATVLPPGGQYPWHYDTNEFVVTIAAQSAEAGGQFEYVNQLRKPGDENLDGLGRILSGKDRQTVRSTANEPGDLQLFLGRYSLHRVTEVIGSRSRHVLVLSYADSPGVIGPLDRTRSVYGRVTEAHLLAAQAVATGADGLIL